MASAAVVLEDDVAKVTRKIAELEDFPRGVKLRRVEDREDHTGDPALFIYLAASKKVPLTAQRITELREVADRVRHRVFEMNLSKYPYVKFLDAR